MKVVGGDWVLDERTGRFVTVSDGQKLSQDLDENFNIDRQPNGFGASLGLLVGLVADPVQLRAELYGLIASSLDSMRALQRRYHLAQRPAEERLAGVSLSRGSGWNSTPVASLNVARVVPVNDTQVSKTTYAFHVDVQTEAGAATGAGGLIIGKV